MKYLEYIELDGRSFIGTKLPPDDQNLALEFWVKPGQSPWGDGGQFGNGQYAVFAGSENGKGDRWAIQTAVLMEEFVGENCGTYTNSIQYFSPEWYHIVVENGELSVYQVDENDGSETLVGQEQFDPSSTSLPNVFIGTLNKEDTDFYDAPCCGVLFGKIIVNGDELLPAEDDEGTQTAEPGTIGWFDETNGVFYENGGDGSFFAGPYVSSGLEFSPASLSVGSAQTTQTISVTNPDGHNYSVASAPNWVNANALPPYDLNVTISENVSGNTARSGDIQVEDSYDGAYYRIPVSQSAGAPIPVPVVESVHVNAVPKQMSFPVTGGTTSGSVQVFVDLAPLDMYWRIHQYEPSDATLTINGVTGLTEYSGTTTGTTNFEIVIPPYTGTGVNWTKYIIECYSGGTKLDYMVGNTPFTIGRRQVTESKSIFLGEDLVDAMYIGDASASKAYIGDQLVWEASSPVPSYDEMPLTFEIVSAGTIMLYTTDSNLRPRIQYRINEGEWQNGRFDRYSPTTINADVGDKIQFIGDNATYATDSRFVDLTQGTAYFKAYGNMMSLVSSTNFTQITELTESHQFRRFFKDSKIVDAGDLVLPATAITPYCYDSMFCLTPIVRAPQLPAMSAVSYCYSTMFQQCHELINAPALPATKLATGCYFDMFDDCINMETAPELPAETLYSSCYQYMFFKCYKINYIKCLANFTIPPSGALGSWVGNVSATGTFVKNPNNTYWSTGTSGIPSGWQVVDDA